MPQEVPQYAQAGTPDPWAYSRQIQQDAAALGFDWPSVHGVLDKIEEELGEIRAAIADADRDHAHRELGDLLLATVNLARFLDADPSRALDEATRRFENRFGALRRDVAASGRTLETCTLGELETVWQRVKHQADQQLKKGS